MKVLITGAGGQLGQELQRTVPEGCTAVLLDRNKLDITDTISVEKTIQAEMPDLIINSAAYTAVDKAEAETEKAYTVNASGVAHIATEAFQSGIRLIHISTDFVFDGRKSSPYLPTDTPSPIGVYGKSKLQGELEALSATQGQSLILRTAWVYSAHGNNFVKSILRLLKERNELGIVADQIGSPTWAKSLARVVWKAAELKDMKGIYHYTDAGVASWYDFAVAIQEEAFAKGLLKKDVLINPIKTEDYPTRAKRPPYSVLDSSSTWRELKIVPSHWRKSLRDMLDELQVEKNA